MKMKLGEAVRTALKAAEANKTKKLSPAQQRMIDEVERTGSSSAPWGYASAGRDASAWHRTADSLKALGLVYHTRTGSVKRALTAEEKAEGLKKRLDELAKAQSYQRSLPATSWGITVNRAVSLVEDAKDSLRDFCEKHGLDVPRAR